MMHHARLLLILCAVAGLQAHSQSAASSPGNDEKPAVKEAAPPPQAGAPETAGQSPANLPDSTKLEPVSKPAPVYPQAAREQALQGQVVIQLEISESGDVESATTVSGEPILAEAAVEAMQKWKFKPYIKDGKAVRVRVKMPHNFAFQELVTKSKESESARQDPVKLRVAQGVIDGNKIYDVAPVYPPEARRRHIQGEVQLRATIGRDGLIHNLEAISGPEELRQAAMGAVQQWRYRPYLLKGEAVEVSTIVTVRFHM
jgi:TonB family protein